MCSCKYKNIKLFCGICEREHLHKVYNIEDVNLCCKCFKVYSNALKLSLLET